MGRRGKGPRKKVVVLQNGLAPPTSYQPDLSFPSMPKFGGQKAANGTMTQPFFVGREVAAMLPDKIDSLKWQTNKMGGGTTEVPKGALS